MGSHQARDVNSRLREIQEEIASLEARLESLRKEEQLLSRNRIQWERIPDDIIREICLACMPVDHNPTMNTKDAPTLLTRISSRWRTIALSTPRLWAALHIAIFSVGMYDGRGLDIASKRLQGIIQWLHIRSGAIPLRISVYQTHQRETADTFGRGVVEVLLECRAQWRCLDLAGTSDLLPLINVHPNTTPLLDALRFFPVRDGLYISSKCLVQSWHKSQILAASRLRRLSVASTLETFANCTMDWSRLTHLSYFHFDNLDVDNLDDIGDALDALHTLENVLRQTPQLIGLTYKDETSLRRQRVQDATNISLLFLEIIDIEEAPDSDISILDLLEAPALKNITYNLNMSGGYYNRTGMGERLLSLLTRSAKSICHLKTNALGVYRTLLDHLRLCPLLSGLELEVEPYNGDCEEIRMSDICEGLIGDYFLEDLVSNDPTRNPCPNLEYFRCSEHSRFSDKGLVEFIRQKQSGRRNISKLKRINVHMCHQQQLDVHNLVSEHIDVGLEVVVEHEEVIPQAKYPLDAGLCTVALW